MNVLNVHADEIPAHILKNVLLWWRRVVFIRMLDAGYYFIVNGHFSNRY